VDIVVLVIFRNCLGGNCDLLCVFVVKLMLTVLFCICCNYFIVIVDAFLVMFAMFLF
jgi:hypothetical protein